MALARIYFPEPLHVGAELDLPPGPARHLQVLRRQPGQELILFPGGEPQGNREYTATIVAMGRQSVQVRITAVEHCDREAALQLHLAVGMPGNERMDWLVEKATELGVAAITPLMTERSVLRLKGERAGKKREHWQAIASAACEQSGRNTVPLISAPMTLEAFVQQQPPPQQSGLRLTLSLSPRARALGHCLGSDPGLWQSATAVTGPEGGLSDSEEALLHAHGYQRLAMGPRTLRSETAPLALAALLLLPH